MLGLHKDISLGGTHINFEHILVTVLHKKGKKNCFNSISLYESRLSKVENVFLLGIHVDIFFWADPNQFKDILAIFVKQSFKKGQKGRFYSILLY